MNTTFSTHIEKNLNRNDIIYFFENKYPKCNKKILKDIEDAIFQHIYVNTIFSNNMVTTTNIFIKKYNYYISEICNSIPLIVDKLKRKEIEITDILKNPIKVYNKNWEFVIKRKEQEEKILAKELVSNSSVAKCFKCKEKNVYVQSVQTRGSDEPATIFYTCLTCSNKWRT